MNLSIGIVHYHAEQFLEQFLRSIQQFPPSCSFEIIVADNGSSREKMQALMKQFSDVKWLQQEKNIGFGSGLNRAVKEALGEYVFFGEL
jgi:GT2 family glycosyltransferase